jgi:hypothetical protein
VFPEPLVSIRSSRGLWQHLVWLCHAASLQMVSMTNIYYAY